MQTSLYHFFLPMILVSVAYFVIQKVFISCDFTEGVTSDNNSNQELLCPGWFDIVKHRWQRSMFRDL